MLHESGEPLFALAQGLLGPPSLHELADLTAQSGHHLQQITIRLSDFVAEEFHDTENLGPVQDGAAKGSMQPFGLGDGRSGEIVILSHVGDP